MRCLKTLEPTKILWTTLTLHEELLYATREIGRVIETGRYLHNYTLTYAFRFVIPPIRLTGRNASARTPEDMISRYHADLGKLKERYVTPANPCKIFRSFITYSARDETIRTVKAREEITRKNVPEFGQWMVISPGSSFECFLLFKRAIKIEELPVFIRLGKTLSKTAVSYKECEFKVVNLPAGRCDINFPLNPDDLPIIPVSFEMELMRPTPIYTKSTFKIEKALRIEYNNDRVMFLPLGMGYFVRMTHVQS